MEIAIIKKVLNLIVSFSLTISNSFSLFGFTLIKKFNLNINLSKPKHELEILDNGKGAKENTEKILKNQDTEKTIKAREKVLKEVINRDIININKLNRVSNSEYFIVIPKMHFQIGRMKRGLVLENGVFENSVFKYLEEQGFINMGKKYTPVYIKNRNELQKKYQNLFLFKQALEGVIRGLWEKDNEKIVKMINDKKEDIEVKKYFYDENGKLLEDKYLFFDFLIVSSLNLNKENLTLFDKESEDNFVLKVSAQEIQDVKLREILLESGLKVFMSERYPSNIITKLLDKEAYILEKLNKENFLEEINKEDLEDILKEILEEDYLSIYKNEFFRIHRVIINYI